jgi:hypothetical protein
MAHSLFVVFVLLVLFASKGLRLRRAPNRQVRLVPHQEGE